MLFVSLSLWKETTFCIHCSPVAGLSGWMYILLGISGSALPAINHWLRLNHMDKILSSSKKLLNRHFLDILQVLIISKCWSWTMLKILMFIFIIELLSYVVKNCSFKHYCVQFNYILTNKFYNAAVSNNISGCHFLISNNVMHLCVMLN